MTEYTNIDRFNMITAVLLEEAYEAFPLPHYIEVTTLSAERPEIFGDEFDPDELTYATLSWLVEEGFIRDKGSDERYLAYVLSLKGFTALNRTPDSLDKSFQQKLKDNVANGSWDAVRSIVPDLLRTALVNGIG
ncbi:hypothetical protein QPM17_21975 [Marinobacter sp. TBZ242]|uniref:DUF2513 domain-containing protein n=1 Tax=Marinobacter azerbaijanicus TaxID=3050455 RepID=A0ABT7IJF3_9GAMM|nr:hypothetical protein [Marinobacter sp. TBZ242]MDL0433813.1 hypothetical protein [Marinobacter sp. TBZ242]